MRGAIVLFGAAALVGVGVLVGSVVAGGEGTPPEADSVVTVRDRAGEPEALTVEEAAARIESLEARLARRDRGRAEAAPFPARAGGDGDDGASGDDGAGGSGSGPGAPLVHPEGRPYTFEELRDLALGSDDPELRASAIRALRADDSAAAREVLGRVLADMSAPTGLRALAARVLASRPHRDHVPEELITAYREETDTAVRRELLRGVTGLRDRRAWMSEISGLLAEEKDPAFRASLLRTLTRTTYDAAARQTLFELAIDEGADPKERRAALNALRNAKPSRESSRALRELLDSDDPRLRAGALRILSSSRGLGLATAMRGLRDPDAVVRITALERSMRQVRTLARDKNVSRDALAQAYARVQELARHDDDANVRRAAVNSIWNLPNAQRTSLLETARHDSDPFVRLTAYARSGRDVARTVTQDFVGALEHDDQRLRDFAYRQLRDLHGVREPFQAGWNRAARERAVEAIRRQVAQSQAR